MCREGGQIICYILSVPDITQNLVVHCNVCRRTWDVQAGTCHSAYEGDGLKGDRLPSGIRTGNDDTACASAGLEVERHARLSLQHRMPRAGDGDIPVKVDGGF